MLSHIYRDLSLLLLIILIFICVSIHKYCAYECVYVCSLKQGTRSSGAGISGGYEPSNVGFKELNSGSQKEKQMILVAHSSIKNV